LTANFQLLPKLNPFARAFHELLLQAAMESGLRKLKSEAEQFAQPTQSETTHPIM
jgi:hypothetical protein